MSKFIHNVSGSTQIIRGIEMADGENYLIPDNLLMSWSNDIVVNQKIISSELKMSKDGVDLIEDPIVGLSFLKGNDEIKTSTGLLKVSSYEPEGDGATIVTHNFADRCSWYSGSTQIIDETLELDSGFTYKSPLSNKNWIDLTHGRCYDEDNVMFQNANKWKLEVKVDDVLKVEDKWFKTNDSDVPADLLRDYFVDYENGKVTFHADPGGVVTVTYSKAGNSFFSIKPKVGKILTIKAAEVQFSKGTILQAPFVFEVWFNHPIYGMIALPGTKICYKNFKDFISACNQGQGLIPLVGELTQDVHVFPFDYARPKPIKYSQNVEIRVYCQNHLPVISEYATATFYVTIETEVM